MFFLSSALAGGLLSLLAVTLRREFPKAKPGRLPVMLLLLIPLTAGAIFGYYPSAVFFGYIIDGWFDNPLENILGWICMALLVYLVFLIARLIARLLSLTKKNTLVSLTLMLACLLAGVYILYVRISDSFI